MFCSEYKQCMCRMLISARGVRNQLGCHGARRKTSLTLRIECTGKTQPAPVPAEKASQRNIVIPPTFQQGSSLTEQPPPVPADSKVIIGSNVIKPPKWSRGSTLLIDPDQSKPETSAFVKFSKKTEKPAEVSLAKSEFELINGWSTDNLRGDLFGALTASVVALPLALAFGVASGKHSTVLKGSKF